MKKLVSLLMLFALLGAVELYAADSTPIRVSLVEPVSAPKNPVVKGLDLGFFATSESETVWGLQLAPVWCYTSGKLYGIQNALVAKAGELQGIQNGCVVSAKTLKGFQNGFINIASEAYGVQFGVVNWAKKMKGLQIGILNVISKGPIPVMLGINVGF